jgi:hypothetical protein
MVGDNFRQKLYVLDGVCYRSLSISLPFTFCSEMKKPEDTPSGLSCNQVSFWGKSVTLASQVLVVTRSYSIFPVTPCSWTEVAFICAPCSFCLWGPPWSMGSSCFQTCRSQLLWNKLNFCFSVFQQNEEDFISSVTSVSRLGHLCFLRWVLADT